MHQATKEYEIEVSDSTDFNPSIDVFVAKGDKMSIQVPKSSKYHKVQRIQEADFLQYFNQTLYKLGSWIHVVASTTLIRKTTPKIMNFRLSLNSPI